MATGWMIGVQAVQFMAGAGNFPLLHCIQTSSGPHPSSYPVGSGGSFARVKVAGV